MACLFGICKHVFGHASNHALDDDKLREKVQGKPFTIPNDIDTVVVRRVPPPKDP